MDCLLESDASVAWLSVFIGENAEVYISPTVQAARRHTVECWSLFHFSNLCIHDACLVSARGAMNNDGNINVLKLARLMKLDLYEGVHGLELLADYLAPLKNKTQLALTGYPMSDAL